MTTFKKLDCLFVYLPQQLPGNGAFAMFMPMGLLALGSLLRQKGYFSQVLHWGIEKIMDPDFALTDYLKNNDVRMVGLSLHWHHQARHCMEAARKIKAASPTTRILLGGFTASYFADQILRKHPAIDFIIRGDAENPLVALFSTIATGAPDLHGVANLSFRQGSYIVHNPITYVANGADLDLLNFADFDLLRHAPTYWRTPFTLSVLNKAGLLDYRTHFLFVGRGCLANCTFCGGARQPQQMVNGRHELAFRSVAKTLETIQQVRQAGIEHLYLSFDPLPKRDYYRELFAAIRQENIEMSLTFECWSLPDSGFIDAFASTFGAGPHSRLILSPESASESLRRRHKGFFYTNKQLYEALKDTGRRQIRTEIYFTYPLPGEKPADIEATRAFITDLEGRFGGETRVYVQNFDLDPGSALFQEPRKFRIKRYCRSFEDYCRAEPGQPKFLPSGLNEGAFIKQYDVWRKRSEKADLSQACHLQYRLGHYLQATRLAQKLLVLDPDDPRLFQIAGCCYERSQPAPAVMELYRKAIARFPDQPAFYQGLRFACFKQGDYPGASQVLSQARQKWPDLPEFQEPPVNCNLEEKPIRPTEQCSPHLPKPRPISIWNPANIDGELYFERPGPSPMGDHYASRRQIRARKGDKSLRVAFFGESVAAGYLYAPGLTPAALLEKYLASLAPAAGYEILDFSRTNETLHGLVTTVESALQLAPDLLVVFAGNNWNLLETPEISPYCPDVTSRREYGRLLEAEGVLGPVEKGARQVLEKAARALQQIAQMASAANLPVILIVPEVNMADWENRQPVTWLPGRKTVHWYQSYFDALDHLQNGNWNEAEKMALRMLKLDRYASSTACHLLARVKREQGREQEAYTACQAAIDNTYYPSIGFLSAPQAGSMAKTIIRKAAGQHGFGCIDLPEIFASYTGQRLQGRRLFLDYCHLTVEGMQVAMAALATEILKFSGVSLTWQQALARLPNPEVPAELDATAKFGAAVHSAHRLLTTADKKSILQYWCEEALKASPQIEQTMLDFVAARHPFLPVVLSAAQLRNLKAAYPMGYQHGWCHGYLDPDVIEVIAAVLEQSGRLSRGQVDDLLMGILADWGPDRIDLLAPPFYLWEPLERLYPECMENSGYTPAAFFRAAWPQSRFALIGEGDRAIRLDITMRLPHLGDGDKRPEGQVTLALNGQKLVRLKVSSRWQKTVFTIRPDLLKRGLNQLRVNWPLPRIAGEQALKMASDRLKTGQTADIHPVFGEIFALRVSWRS